MFGHRLRHAASSPAVKSVLKRSAGASSATGARSRAAIHGAVASIKSRILSSSSKTGSKPESNDDRREENRRSRPGNRLPASLARARQNLDRKKSANSLKRRP